MQAIQNFDAISEVKAKAGLVPGGYVAKISRVADVQEKQYLLVEYEIYEGDFKDYGTEQMEKFGQWPCALTEYKSYKQENGGFFKHFTNCVTEYNPGFTWAWNEQALVGKFIGFTLRKMKYLNSNNEERTKLGIDQYYAPCEIRAGHFEVKDVKPLSKKDQAKLEQSNASTSAAAPTSAW